MRYFSTYYGVYQLSTFKEVKNAIEFLKSKEEILAIEYRNEFNSGIPDVVYGDHATEEDKKGFERRFTTT